MKKYDSYKDSGVDWIGIIPNHWRIGKIKYSDLVIMGQSPLSDECNSDGVGLPFLQGNAEFGFLNPIPKLYCETANKTAKPNDVLLSVRAPVGAINIANEKVGIGRGLCAVRPIKSNTKFIYYWLLKSVEELDSISTGSTFKAVNLDDVKSLNFPIIDYLEQTTIANFLDHKTAQIDDLIAKKERLIQLLEEERTAIINQAVTKGLDPNVPMKDVNVEGLDKIPNHWRLMKFKWVAPIITCGLASTPEYVDESIGMPFLSAQNVKNNRMRLDNYKFIPIELHEKLTKHRKPINGDILVTRVGAGIGDACIVDCEFEFSVYVSLTHIRVDTSLVNNKFIMYFFNTDYCKYLNSQGTVTGGGVGNLNVNNVERYKLPIPSLEEQNIIVDSIERNNEKFNNLTSKLEKEIEFLNEYKTALISEVVTGKVDVRNEKLN